MRSAVKHVKRFALVCEPMDAETARLQLKRRGLLAEDMRLMHKEGLIYIPLKEMSKKPENMGISGELVETLFYVPEEIRTFREELQRFLTNKEYEEAVKGFDTVGNIAIMEIPGILEKNERKIAETLLKTSPAIKTVLKKKSAHGGEFRTQQYSYLAGIDTKVCKYIEHGVRFQFDMEKVYFSVRLSQERKRVADLIEEGEDILVMFSGCGPYPLVLARHSRAKSITGIELNPYGNLAAIENQGLNNIKNVSFIQGDAKDSAILTRKRFDRIIMPLPKSAEEFLDAAFDCAKDECILHFYDFKHIEEFPRSAKEVEKSAERNGFKCDILGIVPCGEYSPRVYRICVDAKVTRWKIERSAVSAVKRKVTRKIAKNKKSVTKTKGKTTKGKKKTKKTGQKR